jgi:hypothetical protein
MWLKFCYKYGDFGVLLPECTTSQYELFSTETLGFSGLLYCTQGLARYRRLTADAQFQSSGTPCGIYGELILTVELTASTLTSSPVTTPSMFPAQLPSGIGESYTACRDVREWR